MLKGVLLLPLLVCLMATPTARAGEVVLPAGTLLQCRLDEPSFPSRSAEVGDPILCPAGSVREFDSDVFPHGAFVAGRFAAYCEPGRLIGKGLDQAGIRSLDPAGHGGFNIRQSNFGQPFLGRPIRQDPWSRPPQAGCGGLGHPRPMAAEGVHAAHPQTSSRTPGRVLALTLKLLEDLSLAQGQISRDGLGPAQSTRFSHESLANENELYEEMANAPHFGGPYTFSEIAIRR